MTKIEEFEQYLSTNGMSDTDFEEYKKLLRRVRGNFSKCQHCYTTAMRFPDKFHKDAVSLIMYGIESFPDGWFTEYTSYLCLGHIYEKIGDYSAALEAFLKAEAALGEEQSAYLADIALDIMWARLHTDNFAYSDLLERYLNRFTAQNSFANELVTNKFKVILAKIVISLHHNRLSEAKEAYNEAMAMCRADFEGSLTAILKKHNFDEKLNTTAEAKKYLNDVCRQINKTPLPSGQWGFRAVRASTRSPTYAFSVNELCETARSNFLGFPLHIKKGTVFQRYPLGRNIKL